MTDKITEITIYWDAQDPGNEGWAYRSNIDSGPIDNVADDDLDGAIREACYHLGVNLTPDDFGHMSEEGGYAIWTNNRSLDR